MNPFIEHHRQSIRLQCSCFDRMLLNAVVEPMQRPALIVGFLDKCKHVPSITRAYFRQVSEDHHRFVGQLASTQGVQIIEQPKSVRREDWVEPFYKAFGRRFGIVVILKSRENARVAVSYPTPSGGNRIEVCTRFVWQYYSICATRTGTACSCVSARTFRSTRGCVSTSTSTWHANWKMRASSSARPPMRS